MTTSTLTKSAAIALALCLGLGFSLWQRQSDATNDWAFTGLDGEPVTRANYASDKVLINFWATWCPPCLRELPLLSTLASDTPDDELRVLAVAYDDPKNIARFLAEHPVSLDFAHGFADVKAAMADYGNVSSSLPFSVLLDRNGKVIEKHLGELLPDTLPAFVASGE
ncbi:MAG: TlpA disulfide reductase family protein [Pseudomonadota bacterium]